ncbi:MAG: hypothetical protein EMLJLAPB_00918 [Candidatus Argoarchaeum ethanivorans]|uniref:Uncharacterized protein n=1 Tax=Candidatus Argoarchaeum ethanivorans TaxID=2608793 RepID=A0A811T4Z5_9EURY|nr:MAG: hypothetical protein KFBDDELM_00189 [Candidatus Argoarchaeum ethanivorans]CAD6494738.1 MAG: hypothetical protein EMLJLAPB_00918 [Candidatus Argoarchaeum ethanivorans]
MWHKSDRNKKHLTIPKHKVLSKGLLRRLLKDAEINARGLLQVMMKHNTLSWSLI